MHKYVHHIMHIKIRHTPIKISFIQNENKVNWTRHKNTRKTSDRCTAHKNAIKQKTHNLMIFYAFDSNAS